MQTLISKLFQSQLFAILFLLLLGSSFFIGIGRTHLFDWDEINFAESAREMLVSGDYFLVQINYQTFWEKPPLFFWLQLLSMHVFGINAFAARLPNAIFGLLSLICVYLIGKRLYSAKFGLLWSTLLYASILPHLYFKSGIIDPVFNLFIFLSVYFTYLSIKQQLQSNAMALVAGVFSGLSFLTKGPVGFLLLLLTLIVVLSVNRFRPKIYLSQFLFFGLGFLSLISIWIGAELLQNGTGNLINFVAYQLQLFSADVAGHKQPFYYHFVVVLIGCFPISILALPNLFKSKSVKNLDFSIWMKSLFWVVMILFSITTTKIVHYSSMAYIPLAFLATLTTSKLLNLKDLYKKWQLLLLYGFGVLWVLILISIPLFLTFKSHFIHLIKDPFAQANFMQAVEINVWDFLGAITFALFALFSFISLRNNKLSQSLLYYVIGIGISLNLVNWFVLPKIEHLSQGAAIGFYKEIKSEDVYLQTLGFKSYAHYFYGEVLPHNKAAANLDFLLNAAIDKRVVIVTKMQNKKLNELPNFELLETRGGFKFYQRLPEK